MIRYATCLSSLSSGGEGPREKTQGAVNPAQSDSPNLVKLSRDSRRGSPMQRALLTGASLGRPYHADAGIIITLAMIMSVCGWWGE